MLQRVSSISCNELQRKHSATEALAQKWQNCMASSYYTFNRILLLCIGLWPYQTSICRHILRTFLSITLASSVAVQLMVLITRRYSVDVLLQILAYSIPFMLYNLKYNLHCIYINKMRILLERIQHDWTILNNAQEFEILKKYSTFGKFITLIVMLCMCLTVFSFTVILILSTFLLNITVDINDSHVQLPILTEYFIDQQKYFFPILFHIFFFVLCGMTTIIAVETFYMSLAQHACGLFQIASWRIRQALHKNLEHDVVSIVERNTIICRRMIHGINMHKRAIEFIEMTQTSCKWAYLSLISLGVLSLIMNLYRFSQVITLNDYHEIIYSGMFLLGHFWYVFFCNYIGQELIDHSSNVFHKIYNAQWYIAPLKAQKLLLLMMQRSMRHCTIVIGGLYVPCLEGVASLTSFSISYFMVIYSMH